jgi:hypothetical protein
VLESLPTLTRLALLLLAGACSGSDSGGHARAAAPIDSQQAQASTAPVERARSGRPVTVTGVVAGEQSEGAARYDRVVFQFADSAAGYRVAYTDGPVRRCGSGEAVALQGTAVLLVRLTPAQAHNADGRPMLVQREMAPGLTVVKDVKLICDFEGHAEWALGLASRQGFRVSELTAPPRLVIDVAHPR